MALFRQYFAQFVNKPDNNEAVVIEYQPKSLQTMVERKIRELQVNGLKVYGLTERIYCYLIAKEYEISYKVVNNDRARFKQFIKKNLKHGGPGVSRAHYLESYIRDYYRDRRIKHLKRKYKIEQ